MAVISILQLKEIAFLGGNLIISAKDYSSVQIKELILAGRSKGIAVTIRNAGILTRMQCKEIAFLGASKVTFDFT